jgi:hypothetical protein
MSGFTSAVPQIGFISAEQMTDSPIDLAIDCLEKSIQSCAVCPLWWQQMEISPIELQRLALNPHNDRHGPLKDEASAIHWLLENRTSHMRSLAEDLAQAKHLYETPLVRGEGDRFIVFDGNRRVCCLKLLLNPKLAPSEKWTEFFSDLQSEEVINAFAKIDCEVEADLATIDEKLYRRHTGSQDGVGQSQWDPEGKSFFLNRTGKASAGLGETIEKALKAEQLIPPDLSLPWSNIERLLSSEPIRKRAGVSFAGGALTYLTDKNKNLQTLQRIANDLSSRQIVLGDLWNNEKKSQYLDRLKGEGLAIDMAPARGASSSPQLRGRYRKGGRQKRSISSQVRIRIRSSSILILSAQRRYGANFNLLCSLMITIMRSPF